uniref:Nonstructural protein n=1 Tax=Dabie bandavirus TaxID=1003835 RepID=A0A125SDJ8_SFTS|nr:nonstructural protein [Severe fever with thrombocytopenia syndrome virus]
MSLSTCSNVDLKSVAMNANTVRLEPSLGEYPTLRRDLVECSCSVLTLSMVKRMGKMTNTVWLFGNPKNPLHQLEPGLEQLLDMYYKDMRCYSQRELSALRWPSGKPSVWFLQAAHMFFSIKNSWAMETGRENWRGLFHRITKGRRYLFEGDMILDSLEAIEKRRLRLGLPDILITGLSPILDVALLQIESLARLRGMSLNHHLFTSSSLRKPLLDCWDFFIPIRKKKTDGSYSVLDEDDEPGVLQGYPYLMAHYLNRCPFHNLIRFDEELRTAALNTIWGRDWPAIGDPPKEV